MKKIIILVALNLLQVSGYSQGAKIPFGGTTGTDTANTPNSIRTAKRMVLPAYEDPGGDTTVLGIVKGSPVTFPVKKSTIAGWAHNYYFDTCRACIFATNYLVDSVYDKLAVSIASQTFDPNTGTIVSLHINGSSTSTNIDGRYLQYATLEKGNDNASKDYELNGVSPVVADGVENSTPSIFKMTDSTVGLIWRKDSVNSMHASTSWFGALYMRTYNLNTNVWGSPHIIYTADSSNPVAAFATMVNGTISVIFNKYHGAALVDSGLYVTYSTNFGSTFSNATSMGISSALGYNAYGKATLLPNGKYVRTIGNSAITLLYSTTDGISYTLYDTIKNDIDGIPRGENQVLYTRNNIVLNIARTTNASSAGSYYLYTSLDTGHNWTYSGRIAPVPGNPNTYVAPTFIYDATYDAVSVIGFDRGSVSGDNVYNLCRINAWSGLLNDVLDTSANLQYNQSLLRAYPNNKGVTFGYPSAELLAPGQVIFAIGDSKIPDTTSNDWTGVESGVISVGSYVNKNLNVNMYPRYSGGGYLKYNPYLNSFYIEPLLPGFLFDTIKQSIDPMYAASYMTVAGRVSSSWMKLFLDLSAFRYGRLTTDKTLWDISKIGQYSTAFGLNTNAPGQFAMAMGSTNISAGSASVSMGLGNYSGGDYNGTWGRNDTTGTNNYSFALGRLAKATFTGSWAIGDGNATQIASSANNQMNMRFSGGYRLYTNTAFTSGLFATNSSGGQLGINVTSPATILDVGAGNASNAPFRINSGTLRTTALGGTLEYDGTDYYFTVGSTRYTMAKTLAGSATLDFPSTNAQTSSELTVTVAGAASGDVVNIGVPATTNANSCFTARVSATNTVTVKFNNYSASPIDPASGAYKVVVQK